MAFVQRKKGILVFYSTGLMLFILFIPRIQTEYKTKVYALFRCKKFWDFDTVAFLFLFD